MTQPPASASASYYKIAASNYVTFGWNLTSLYVTPTSLTVVASCSQNGNTYPVGPTNAAGEVENVIPGSSTQVVWSPFDYEQNGANVPLAAATYRLQIYDERGPTAAQAGGRFSPYSGMEFALYRPQAYTPLPEWNCVNCNSATKLAMNPMALMLFTSLIMLVSGWGLIGGAGRRNRA